MAIRLVEVEHGAKIKVVGVGGAGGNAINNMILEGLQGVDFIVANTDLQALGKSPAPTKIQLGCELTRGLGAGGNPEVGRRAAEENLDAVRKVLEGADMVFVTAGLGGGTGTGAAPLIAEAAREQGALTVAVTTKPFHFEGKKRMRAADQGIKELKSKVDTLITIPNDRLLAAAPKNAMALTMFKQADGVLLQAVRGITDLITVTGYINPDFADLRAVMSEKGLALMGTGMASGDNRAIEAATKAISNPLLEDISIDGARGVLINITTSPEVTMTELQDAAILIQKEADEEANVIWGWVVDENCGDQFRVTVIATGIGPREEAAISPASLQAIRDEFMRNHPKTRPWGDEHLDVPPGIRTAAAAGGGERDYPPASQEQWDGSLDMPTFIRKAVD